MPGGRPPRDASELGARWGSVAGNGLDWGRGPRDWGGSLGSERPPQNGEGAMGKGERDPWVGGEMQVGGGLGMSEELGFGIRLSKEYGTDSLLGKGPG